MMIDEYKLENWLPLTIILVVIFVAMAGVEIINHTGRVVKYVEGVTVSCEELSGKGSVDASVIQLTSGERVRVYEEKGCRVGEQVRLEVQKASFSQIQSTTGLAVPNQRLQATG